MNPPATSRPAAIGPLPPERWRYWIATIGRFGTVQAVSQAIMAGCGLLIVRHLSKQEYSLFIVANTVQGMMSALSDAGAAIGMTAIGGKVWQDRHRLGQVLNSSLGVRRRMTAAAAAVGTPLLMWMLRRNGAGLAYAVGLAAVTLVGLYFLINASIYRGVLQLHSRVGRMQALDLFLPVARTLLTAGLILVFFDALTAIAVMTVVVPLQWWQVRRWAHEEIDPDAPPSAEDQALIYAKVRNVLPDTIFYCLQGQLWIGILSFFGRSDHVAEVGALGRLALLFNIIMSVMNSILVPAFSRCQDARILRRRYMQIVTSFVALGAVLVGVAVLLPGPLLFLLGTNYEGLQYELALSVGLSALSGVATAMWTLNAAKGWTDYLWADIPLRLVLQVGLFFAFDLSTVRGVLYFLLASNLSPLLVTAWLARRGLRAELESGPHAYPE